MRFRVKDLFNSRGIIALLCIAAGAAVYVNVVPLIWPEELTFENVVEDFGDWTEAERQLDVVRYDLRAIDATALAWNANPVRDPFSVAEDITLPAASSTTNTAPVRPAIPRLNALVAGARSRFAVIDDRIVGEGDSLGAFRVSEITPDEVVLDSPGTASLRLKVNP